MTADGRLRCGWCQRLQNETETVLVSGRRAGNYRRPSTPTRRRVCRTCTERRVARARENAAEGRSDSLDEGMIEWSSAARHFEIDVEGLQLRHRYRRPDET